MKVHGDFLLEIGCEEIPASMIAKASHDLKEILENSLATQNLLGSASIETYGAPRRLVAEASGILLQQEDVKRIITGPPKSVAFDDVGRPTRAAESFATKQGVPVSRLRVTATPRGECVTVEQVIPGRAASEILQEILPQAILDLSFPRSMVWTGAHGPRFVRPIRWVVALLDGQAIPFSVAGVRTGNQTQGHRFLGQRKIPVTGPRDYESKLQRNFVLCRPEARREKIESEIRALANRKKLRAHQDAGLLEQVTYLNEFPAVILGDFDSAFLSLPEEILITVMRDHQKYFALQNRSRRLAPHFLAVINLPRDPKGLVRAGHERVLRARFADARFFWETDQKRRLGDYLPKLAHVTFESRLGSYADKVERLRVLARWIAEQWFSSGVAEADVAGTDRAAELSKCDLVTEMVREFPELQGIVGGLYAKTQGEAEEIAWGVYDHYRPLGLGEPIPRNLIGCAVSLADKLDSLVACFAIGAIPSGSSDPFALRRAALGIVQILLERSLPLSLSAAVSAAAKALKEDPPKMAVKDSQEQQTLDFIHERARFVLRERRGFAYDEVAAAFAAGADDLVDATQRVQAVKAIRRTRNFESLAIAFKRIRNILEKSAKEGDKTHAAPRAELFRVEAERQLFEAARRVNDTSESLKRSKKYREALEAISQLRPAVDRFFDKVLVMTEDAEIRRNRVALLGSLLREFSTIADFSEIVAEEPKEKSRAAEA